MERRSENLCRKSPGSNSGLKWRRGLLISTARPTRCLFRSCLPPTKRRTRRRPPRQELTWVTTSAGIHSNSTQPTVLRNLRYLPNFLYLIWSKNIKVLFRTGLVGVTRLFQAPQTRILANSLRELQHVTQVLSSSTCAGSTPPSPPCTLTSLQVCSWSQVSETIEGLGRLWRWSRLCRGVDVDQCEAVQGEGGVRDVLRPALGHRRQLARVTRIPLS